MPDKVLYKYIRKAFAAGRVIPFFGAGASVGARLPTGRELTNQLGDLCGLAKEERGDLAKVAQYFAAVIGRKMLRASLHEIFDARYEPLAIHRYVAQQKQRPILVVTTNYDDLIEQAFREAGHPFDLVIHSTDNDRLLWWPHPDSDDAAEEAPIEVMPNKLDIDLETRSAIYKMHGAVDREDAERDQYVISEDDYIDFLARMTKNRAVPAIFAERFRDDHFLFLGYGLYDWNLRVVLNRISRSDDVMSWAIQDGPNDVEQKLWEKRGVLIYDLKIEEFAEKLAGGYDDGD